MRALAVGLALLLGAPAYLAAQQRAPIEVGTRAGISYLFNTGSLTTFSVPGGGPSPFGAAVGGNASVHAAFFPGGNVMVEPQVSFALISESDGGETITNIALAGQVAYLFNGARANSAYVGANAAFVNVDLGEFFGSENDFAAGGTLGYRFLPYEHVAIRLEASYRRWFDFEVNELDGAVILGVVF